jgi:hypothetical protein
MGKFRIKTAVLDVARRAYVSEAFLESKHVIIHAAQSIWRCNATGLLKSVAVLLVTT